MLPDLISSTLLYCRGGHDLHPILYSTGEDGMQVIAHLLPPLYSIVEEGSNCIPPSAVEVSTHFKPLLCRRGQATLQDPPSALNLNITNTSDSSGGLGHGREMR